MFQISLFFFSDGEQALIIASRSLGQENGPMVRRLVERSHANRNIEDNLKSLVPDQSHFAQFLSQWYKFCDSKSQIEAETSIKFMKEMFSKHKEPISTKLLSTFRIYFEDPKMICRYGLEGVPEKHFGPAEAEGYQNLFKNIYTQGLNSNSPPDDVLYQAYQLRKKMTFRFFEDYTNSKLPKALEIIKEKYHNEGQIDFESGKPVSANRRKSPRSPRKADEETQQEGTEAERKGKKIKRTLFQPNLPFSPARKRDMSEIFNESANERSPSLNRSADADANVPYVGDTSCTMTHFSKKPKIKQLQRRKMFKKYKGQIDQRMEGFAKELFEAKRRFTFRDISSEDFVTSTNENEPQILSNILTSIDPDVQLLSINDIAMVGSTFEPQYKIWDSLHAIELDQDTEFIAENRYFEVNMGSPIAAAVKLFFMKCIRLEGDNTTNLKNIAFQYIVRESSDMPYIAIVGMTNRGISGNKYVPFTFQIVLPGGRVSENVNVQQLEGVWHIKPEYDSISDTFSSKKRMKYSPNADLRNNIVETLMQQYQVENSIEDACDDDVILGADGAAVNTYAIAALKIARKEVLVLVKIVTTGAENLTLEVFKSVGNSRKIWQRNQTTIVKKKRHVLQATGVCVKVDTENLILSRTPHAIVKFASATSNSESQG